MPLMLPTMLNGRGRKSTEQGSRYHWILSRCHWISCCPPAKPRLHREFESHAACILWFQRRILDLALPLGARLAVVTPSHQCPLGVMLSLPRRLELLAWATKTGAWIIEDDYDGEFRYHGRPLPALKSLDDAGRV